MAGIGFVLRKLAKQDNLIGMFQAYAHSALASTGPWLFTVFALGSIVAVGSRFMSNEELFNFKIIIIYNFSFSLVFAGPVFMVATRYLADCIHRKDVTTAPGMLLGATILMFCTQLPIVAAFYIFVADLTPSMTLGAIVSFLLISSIWLVSVFMTALKDYKAITQTFGTGLLIAVAAAAALAKYFGATGMICGFSIGLCFIVSSLIAKIFAEYPYRFKQPFAFMPYFKRYWEVALSGIVYNCAAWTDKWVMWFAPEREVMENNLILYSNYDSAMFMAYLSIVPSMAIFVFSMETNFFEHYLKFYRDIQNKATFQKIMLNHKFLINSVLKSGRNFIVLQGSICVMTILMAPKIFQLLGINFLQIGIFRYGTLGAFFHVLTMFLVIMLSYFDNRKASLFIQAVFMISNLLFSIISMKMGFTYYGYGYFMATLITFITAFIITMTYIARLPFHTFITTNTSVS